MKIKTLKTGALSESDRLTIASLLIKSGYLVRIGREKIASTDKYEYFVEIFNDERVLAKFNL